MMADHSLKKTIPGISECEREAHFNLLPDSYFVENAVGDIVLHLQMVHDLLNRISDADSVGTLIPIINWSQDADSIFARATIVTWDRAGLFHKLAASFFYAGYSIKSASAISREDNIAIDTFVVNARDQKNFNDHYARQIFEECLNKKLASTNFGDSKLDEFIETLDAGDTDNANTTDQRLSPKVEVYEEISKRKATVETHSSDTPGLLYRLAQVVHSHEFDITAAHIHTERGIAFDQLYIKSRDPKARIKSEQLSKLKCSLLATLRRIAR
ncbi:MAG TPA: hypothetical protein DIV79_11695 [Opitutae bacterium]|mgnify:CR=1 FL=1|nr:hypothetical protein [Opitutae bacterium]|tara:strand:+ start:530 stop:1342 length:813 start_codon:yes stop_codon:yes gene_type:complete